MFHNSSGEGVFHNVCRSELVARVCFTIVCDRSELVARVCFTIVCDRSELVARVCFTIVCGRSELVAWGVFHNSVWSF